MTRSQNFQDHFLTKIVIQIHIFLNELHLVHESQPSNFLAYLSLIALDSLEAFCCHLYTYLCALEIYL